MLYLGTAHDIAVQDAATVVVEEVAAERAAVRQWLSLPSVKFVGAHTRCSCGFPSIIAEEPIEYYDGFFDDRQNRDKDLESVRALFALIGHLLESSSSVELLPVWEGDEHVRPIGIIERGFAAMDPETFFFTEHFLYRISR